MEVGYKKETRHEIESKSIPKLYSTGSATTADFGTANRGLLQAALSAFSAAAAGNVEHRANGRAQPRGASLCGQFSQLVEPGEHQHHGGLGGGRAFRGNAAAKVEAVCTDSRALKPGALFVALRGEKFDGHDFIRQAAQAGAAGAVVEEAPAELPGDFAVIRVEDTLAALQRMAASYRRTLAGEGNQRDRKQRQDLDQGFYGGGAGGAGPGGEDGGQSKQSHRAAADDPAGIGKGRVRRVRDWDESPRRDRAACENFAA